MPSGNEPYLFIDEGAGLYGQGASLDEYYDELDRMNQLKSNNKPFVFRDSDIHFKYPARQKSENWEDIVIKGYENYIANKYKWTQRPTPTVPVQRNRPLDTTPEEAV